MFNELLAAISIAVKASQNHINQDLLKEIINFENQQIQKLDSLLSNIEAIQNGPFYSGMACLQDAQKEHRTQKERYELVNQAKQYFISSLGIYSAKQHKDYKDFFILGYIQSYIAVCWALLGKVVDSIDWFILSKESLTSSLDEQNQIIGDLHQELSKLYSDIEMSILGGASIPGFARGFAAKSLQGKLRKKEKIFKELETSKIFKEHTEEFVDFIDRSLNILKNLNQTQDDGYLKYIPIAQELISDLAHSESIQNDKLKSGMKKISNLLSHISKE